MSLSNVMHPTATLTGSNASPNEHQRIYGRVVAEMTQKRWTGDGWVWSVDCAAAHRIARLIIEQRPRE